ncbi:MAG: formate--tetrahydrofolate ligase [Planctomycetota bacterium]|nr:MAG: formate--tetrahydrofolate ligase [Planctomycetota bacterium]
MASAVTRWPSDLEIAKAATLLPMADVAAKLGLTTDDLEPYGHTKAKLRLDSPRISDKQETGKLILVTAINPTSAGEGKTTTTVGLGDALNRIGHKTTICLREPSLGPCFGMKGGAAGGGRAQVVPMEDINLHFTGDFHAIGLAHNLLSAVLDNHMHHGNELGIDPRRVVWRRVVDLNERALRNIICGLGGPMNSVPRESGFDITVASEVMACFCLAESLHDLRERLGAILVGKTYDRKWVTAADLKVHGAMTALLRDAFQPNLVQTLEGNPALVHGGPFANIAHGCNSVMATRTALKLSDIVVTEAGFGADLGAEKFLNIKCRKAGLRPDAVVIVATIRALKLQGGAKPKELGQRQDKTLERGLSNLAKHIDSIQQFGLPAVVAINAFVTDLDEELELVRAGVEAMGATAVRADHWAKGGEGAEDLARAVVELLDSGKADFRFLYPDDIPLIDKVRTICQRIYGADDISADTKLRRQLAKLDEDWGHLPICMAKTQNSLSTDPKLMGRPEGFKVPLREVKVCAGAGFVLVLTGNILTMPGLPKVPAAEAIDVDENGEIVGLF